MLEIECPWCGFRDEPEFRCGGQSHITRPGPFDQVSEVEWADYLYFRINPNGLHYERWVHEAGCARWFNVVRDTRTHKILASYRITDPKPLFAPEKQA